MYLARGGFEPAAPMLNSVVTDEEARAEAATEGAQTTGALAPAEAKAPEAEADETAAKPFAAVARRYDALTTRKLAILAVCALVGIGLIWRVKPHEIGDFVRFSINAKEAQVRSDQVMRDWKIDPASYRHAATTTFSFDPSANEYLRRAVGVNGANQIYKEQVPLAYWAVRYFRDSQKEEYLVVLLPDGGLHSVHHTLDDDAPGATLTKEDAQARAGTYLRREKHLDLTQWKVVEAQSEKQVHRTDHHFVWEQIAPLATAPGASAPAHVRVQLDVQGDEVSGYKIFVYVPEDWERNESESTLAGTAQRVGFILFLAGLGLTVLVIFFRNLKHPEMSAMTWRRMAKWSVWVLVAAALKFMNSTSQYWSLYDTKLPLKIYVGTVAIGLTLGSVLLYTVTFFVFGLAWFLLSRAFGKEQLPHWNGMPANYYRDALCIALLGAAAWIGFQRLPSLLWRAPLLQHSVPAAVPTALDGRWPGLSAIASAVILGFLLTALLCLAAGFLADCLRSRWPARGACRRAGGAGRERICERRIIRAWRGADALDAGGDLVGCDAIGALQSHGIFSAAYASGAGGKRRTTAATAEPILPRERLRDRRIRRAAARVAGGGLATGHLRRGPGRKMMVEPEPSPAPISRARQWGEYVLAILAGNIFYLLIEPQLPTALRHHLFRVDAGVLIDFVLCAMIYGVIRLARTV